MDASGLPRIAQELARCGYGGSDIARILGGNTMRVLSEVEAVAEPSKSVSRVFKHCLEMGHTTDQNVPVLSAMVEEGMGRLNYSALMDGASWFKDPAYRSRDTPAIEVRSPQASIPVVPTVLRCRNPRTRMFRDRRAARFNP